MSWGPWFQPSDVGQALPGVGGTIAARVGEYADNGAANPIPDILSKVSAQSFDTVERAADASLSANAGFLLSLVGDTHGRQGAAIIEQLVLAFDGRDLIASYTTDGHYVDEPGVVQYQSPNASFLGWYGIAGQTPIPPNQTWGINYGWSGAGGVVPPGSAPSAPVQPNEQVTVRALDYATYAPLCAELAPGTPPPSSLAMLPYDAGDEVPMPVNTAPTPGGFGFVMANLSAYARQQTLALLWQPVVPPVSPMADVGNNQAWSIDGGAYNPPGYVVLAFRPPLTRLWVTGGPEASLRMTQRDDGAGVIPHPRLNIPGAGSNQSTSVQTAAAPRVGENNRYR